MSGGFSSRSSIFFSSLSLSHILILTLPFRSFSILLAVPTDSGPPLSIHPVIAVRIAGSSILLPDLLLSFSFLLLFNSLHSLRELLLLTSSPLFALLSSPFYTHLTSPHLTLDLPTSLPLYRLTQSPVNGIDLLLR